MALIMPSTAVVTNDVSSNSVYERREIQGSMEKRPQDNTLSGGDVLVTPFIGDDYIPSITQDSDYHTVVSWTNEQSFSESNWGISYSSDPSDQNTWYDNALVLTLTGNDYYWDTAFIQSSVEGEYEGLMGVFFSLSEQQVGYYEIDDITGDFADWPVWTWSSAGEDPYYASIADGGFVDNGGDRGPYYSYVCFNDLCPGDIAQCPIFVFLDVAGEGGSFYYDCQDFEKTAPSGIVDYVFAGTYYHTVTHNVDTDKVIWKKVDPAVQPDYEYTPFQATIADGTDPKIAFYGTTNVAVVFADGGEVKCVRSVDDGETWGDPLTIASGGFPDICAVGTVLYATYISGGNLFKISSDDGGASWSQAEQVNDIDGTVVAMENSVDIHQAGIVWVDERGEDLDIYFDELVNIPLPKIEIEQIAGGIGVSAKITNNGDAVATDVVWSITLDGTVFLGGEATDTISSIAVGESVSISSGFPLGFGPIDITITAQSAEGPSDSETASGTLILFYIIGL